MQNYPKMTGVDMVLKEKEKEVLQGIIADTDLKDEVYNFCLKVMAAMPPHSTTDLDIEIFHRNFNSRENLYLDISRPATSDSKSAMASNKSKEKKRVRSNRKGLDILKGLKILQQRDVENQQVIQLLMLNHNELLDRKELSTLGDMEGKLTAERLKCEDCKNFDVSKKMYQMFEDGREKLSMAKGKHFVKQVKALLEKYERLRKHADTISEQLLEERTKRKWCQKALKRVEEVKMNEAFLEDQAAIACKKKMQILEEEHNEYVWPLLKFDKERSAMIAEVKSLKVQLCIAQGENQKLKQALQANKFKKSTAKKNLQDSQKLVGQLYEELDESNALRKSTAQRLEAMEAELKRVQNSFIMETIQLHKQIKSRMQHFEAKTQECETLKELVATLKTDKKMLKEELQSLQKSDTVNKREGEKLREALCLLEHERKLLLEEMGDLRKDYFSLSDRIAQRLGQLELTEGPMCITDLSSNYHNRTVNEFNTADQIIHSTDLIQHIKKKLEKEENRQ